MPASSSPAKEYVCRREEAAAWFRSLRDTICSRFEQLEDALQGTRHVGLKSGRFERKVWQRESGGGGEMSVMKGRVFEKVGVNISTVHGKFSDEFIAEMPHAKDNPYFWASGISLVAHMQSPLVPAVHMNTRHIHISSAPLEETGEDGEKWWFGGGADLTPMYPDEQDTKDFHAALQAACDTYQPDAYAKYKKWCDEYFFLKHRNEPRGVGGIFYDYVSEDWDRDFAFTKAVGTAFADIYPELVRRHMDKDWTEEQREHQLHRRGRYVEFNLLYDRGTRFGLMTDGNVDAILMSLPPEVKWA